MSKFVGFGSGRDGLVPASGSINEYGVASGASGQQIVTTPLSVDIGDIVCLVQMQAGGVVGAYEFVVVIDDSTPGQFTAGTNLDNTYSGIAQAIKVYEASGGTISGTLTPQAWNGSTGGLGVIFGGGKITISGHCNSDGLGFRGGSGSGSCNCGSNPSYSGEGTAGASVFGLQTPNGNGGGGVNGNGMDGGPGGAGGGYGTAGSNGGSGQGTGGDGGLAVGSADMSTLHLGGGGGGGRGEKNGGGNGGNGGAGGGGWIIFAREIEVTSGGFITSRGNNGSAGSGSSDGAGGGGAGSGGFIFLKGQFITIANANNIMAYGGTGGTPGVGAAGAGGNGGTGRIRLEACRITIGSGGSNPSYSSLQGGFTFCGSLASMLE